MSQWSDFVDACREVHVEHFQAHYQTIYSSYKPKDAISPSHFIALMQSLGDTGLPDVEIRTEVEHFNAQSNKISFILMMFKTMIQSGYSKEQLYDQKQE